MKYFFQNSSMQFNNKERMDTFNFDTKLSLYIPRIYPKWSYYQVVANVFHSLDIGKVHRVDFINKTDRETGQLYSQAFVHFEYWYETPTAYSYQEKILDPTQQAKIVYDDPWFWLLLKCNKPLTDAEKKIEERIYILEKQVEEQAKMIAYLSANTRCDSEIILTPPPITRQKAELSPYHEEESKNFSNSSSYQKEYDTINSIVQTLSGR